MFDYGEIIAIDVETTGISPLRGHRIIEIGAVRISHGELTDEFHSLIDCGRPSSIRAQQVHGITPAMLVEQPAPREALSAFRGFVGTACLAAHNAAFDRLFLRHEYGRLGWRLANRTLCTLELSRKKLPDLPDYRLETVARHLLGDLPPETRLHRALDDARLVANVWISLENTFG